MKLLLLLIGLVLLLAGLSSTVGGWWRRNTSIPKKILFERANRQLDELERAMAIDAYRIDLFQSKQRWFVGPIIAVLGVLVVIVCPFLS